MSRPIVAFDGPLPKAGLRGIEKAVIVQVLRHRGGEVKPAAEDLRLSRSALYAKIARHGIDLGALPRARGRACEHPEDMTCEAGIPGCVLSAGDEEE